MVTSYTSSVGSSGTVSAGGVGGIALVVVESILDFVDNSRHDESCLVWFGS